MLELQPRIRDSALNFLAIREHSQLELRQKLLRKDFPLELINEVLNQLHAENLQSDARFTESFIRSRINKGQGYLRIRYELQQLGISAALLNEYLDENDAQWQQLAQQVRKKKFGTALPRDPKQKAKQIRFLQYRGFSATQIQRALRLEDEM